MYHEGDLQSGIASAVQQLKAVLCFVGDESQVSKEWQAILLSNEETSGTIAAKTVALYIKAGSQEAGFLSSFCPINFAPTIIIIKDGLLRENIHNNEDSVLTEEELKTRLKKALDDSPAATSAHNTSLSNAANSMPANSSTVNDPAPDVGTRIPTAARHAEAAPAPGGPHLDVFAEPATSARDETSNTSNHTETIANAAPNPVSTTQRGQRADYVKMQKERKRQQREERERIKAQIKADRIERRRLEELRKRPLVDRTSQNDGNTIVTPKSSALRIQVRTFDGSTLRNPFPPTASIVSDVRPWIDKTTSQNAPYNLKLILTPLPNRKIEAGEEEQSLSDLGIRGSCTFIMEPVKGYVDSYTSSNAGGLVGSAVSGGYNLVTGTAGAAFGGVRSILGWGQPAEQPRGDSTNQTVRDDQGPNEAPLAHSQVRMRTLADQRAEERRNDHQFYNGNQLNFEPRRDEDKQD